MTRKSLREHLVTLHPPFYVAFTNAIYLNNRERCFFVLSRAWDKEKILSPNEKSNLRPSDSALRCSTTVTQRLHCEYGLLRSSHDTRKRLYVMLALMGNFHDGILAVHFAYFEVFCVNISTE